MKLWTIHVQMGVPEAIGSNVPNFVKDVPRGSKVLSKVEMSPQSLPYGFLNEPHWTIGHKMGVPLALGFGIPHFIKDELVTQTCIDAI